MNRSHALLIVALLLPACAPPRPSRRQAIRAPASSSRRAVRPVLVARCYECHQADSEAETTLRLDSLAGMLAGGDLGPAIKPGDAKGSLLVRRDQPRRRGRDAPQNQVARARNRRPDGLGRSRRALARRRGAGERGDRARQQVRHLGQRPRSTGLFSSRWSQPVPAVRNGAWPRNSIDHFVLAGLEAQGLAPARPADRRTLIRRADLRSDGPAADAGGDRRLSGR